MPKQNKIFIMITAKFGGTAVTAQNLHCIKSILTPFHKCVVVSAVGREHPRDDKVTDLLMRHYSGDPLAWGKICQKYRRLVEVNGVQIDVDALLYDAERRSRAYDLAYCLSLGEELAARIVAKFLNACYVEAQDVVVFNGKRLALSATFANVKSAFLGLSRGVMGGFYGGLLNKSHRQKSLSRQAAPRQIFPRGGGDITGAICAVATDSALYENWTDVYGVCLADPKRVGGVTTAPNLSYAEMRLLSQNGAEVLHSQAVNFVARRGIPIKIGNYLNPQGAATLVSNCPSGLPLLLATEVLSKSVYHTTVLFTLPTQKAVQLLGKLFDSLCPPSQNLCALFDFSRYVSHSACDASTPAFAAPSTPCASSPAPTPANGVTVYSCRVTHNRADIFTSQSVLKRVYAAFSSQN